jgi:hypothetical protein
MLLLLHFVLAMFCVSVCTVVYEHLCLLGSCAAVLAECCAVLRALLRFVVRY